MCAGIAALVTKNSGVLDPVKTTPATIPTMNTTVPETSDPVIAQARDTERARKRAVAASSTVLTGAKGVTDSAAIGVKALLGA